MFQIAITRFLHFLFSASVAMSSADISTYMTVGPSLYGFHTIVYIKEPNMDPCGTLFTNFDSVGYLPRLNLVQHMASLFSFPQHDCKIPSV